jgi:hypothetical protein
MVASRFTKGMLGETWILSTMRSGRASELALGLGVCSAGRNSGGVVGRRFVGDSWINAAADTEIDATASPKRDRTRTNNRLLSIIHLLKGTLPFGTEVINRRSGNTTEKADLT